MEPHLLDMAAPLTTGADLKNWILIVGGNVFIAILAVRAIGYFIKDDWGKMITLVVGAVFVGACVWAPDAVQGFLTGVWGKVSGSA